MPNNLQGLSRLNTQSFNRYSYFLFQDKVGTLLHRRVQSPDRMDLPLTALSLFSGAGGDTLGLERAGFKVLAFNEFNKAAIETHKANFPDSELIYDSEKNITDITKLPDEKFEPYKDKIGIVFAGFPCQGFSHAGKKKVNDPRNQMFRHFVRTVRIVRPKYFIGENVVGLRSMKSGPNEDDPLMLDLIIQAFREIGYELTYNVLEATDYGVPQKRKRILLIGWDTKRTTIDPASFWASVAGEGAKKPVPKMSSFVRAVLEDAYTLKPDEIPEGFDENAILAPSVLKPTGKPHPFIVLKAGEKLLSCTKRDSPVHSEVLNLNNPCKTIICTYDHQPRLLVGLKNKHGSFVRCLLPDELKQIQGFPADFKLCGNMKEQVVQVGNAVPPPFVTSVATVLKTLG